MDGNRNRFIAGLYCYNSGMADRRSRKTKDALKKSLISLLGKKRLGEITITEITELADVNRSTFYAYYASPVDCFDEITDEIIIEMRNAVRDFDTVNYQCFLSAYFDSARKHREVFIEAHSYTYNHPFIRKIQALSFEYSINATAFMNDSSDLEKSFILSGFYGMVAAWLKNGCKETDEELIALMQKLFPQI